MSADFNKVVTTENYATLKATITDLFKAVAQGLDPAVVTPVNTPTNAVRWNLVTNKRLEKYNGSAWVNAEPTGGYSINISGSAAKWTTGRTITLTGAVTGASGAFDGSGNLSFATTLATVAANKGGTGLTSYTVGDMLYASAAGTLSKLADVAAGNVLLSGGVGLAPAYGKVGLTTHVSGILAQSNGGSGASTPAGARINFGLVIGTDVMGMGGGTFTGAVAATNLSGTNTGDEPAASTTVAGVAELATNAEVQAGTDAARIVTPAGLRACSATTTRAGVIETATDAEAQAQVSAAKALTPSNLAALQFESAEQTFLSAGSSIAVNHGLGANPVSVEVVYRCKVSNGGYAVGDEYLVSTDFGSISGVGNSSVAAWKNATQVGVSAWFMAPMTTKDGTGSFAPTAASWRTVLRAKLI